MSVSFTHPIPIPISGEPSTIVHIEAFISQHVLGVCHF